MKKGVCGMNRVALAVVVVAVLTVLRSTAKLSATTYNNSYGDHFRIGALMAPQNCENDWIDLSYVTAQAHNAHGNILGLHAGTACSGVIANFYVQAKVKVGGGPWTAGGVNWIGNYSCKWSNSVGRDAWVGPTYYLPGGGLLVWQANTENASWGYAHEPCQRMVAPP